MVIFTYYGYVADLVDVGLFIDVTGTSLAI